MNAPGMTALPKAPDLEPVDCDVDQNAPLIAYKEPLSPMAKRGLLAAVIFFHVGAGYALTQIEPGKIMAGDGTPMEVSFVTDAPAEQPAQPEQQVDLATPPPEDTPPPEVPLLESMVQPPEPDLPPPEFPVPPPPPPKPVVAPPPKPRPQQPKPQQQQAAPANPTPNPNPNPSPAAAAPGPKQLSESQVAFINRPNPDYPVRARRAGHQGQTMVKFLIEPSGRPSQVSVDKSSGYPDLDAAAVSGVKAALLRPYVENGVPRPIWAVVQITFKLN